MCNYLFHSHGWSKTMTQNIFYRYSEKAREYCHLHSNCCSFFLQTCEVNLCLWVIYSPSIYMWGSVAWILMLLVLHDSLLCWRFPSPARDNPRYQFMLEVTQMESTLSEEDSGILVDTRLNTSQCALLTSKVNAILDCIRQGVISKSREAILYSACVRIHLKRYV